MHARVHLHQAVCPHRAGGKRVEARFDRHYGQDQRGIELQLPSDLVGFGHQRAQRLAGHAVFARQPVRQSGLFLGQAGQIGRDHAFGDERGVVTGRLRRLTGQQPFGDFALQRAAPGRLQRQQRHTGQQRQPDGGQCVAQGTQGGPDPRARAGGRCSGRLGDHRRPALIGSGIGTPALQGGVASGVDAQGHGHAPFVDGRTTRQPAAARGCGRVVTAAGVRRGRGGR